jgi:hypothetical protein
MSIRVPDYALIIGHVWRCTSCREALFQSPETVWMGYKLDDSQRERIRQLTDESFQTVTRLCQETGLDARELEAAIEHPRARLRHLGSVKGDAYHRFDSSF